MVTKKYSKINTNSHCEKFLVQLSLEKKTFDSAPLPYISCQASVPLSGPTQTVRLGREEKGMSACDLNSELKICQSVY
jgi:hypothetical protein